MKATTDQQFLQRARTRAFVRHVMEEIFNQETSDAEIERISERVEKALGLPLLDVNQNAVRVVRQATEKE